MHSDRPRGRFSARALAISLASLWLMLAVLAAPGAASAATTTTAATAPGTPVLVTSMTRPPAGYRLNAGQVQRIALADPRVKAELRKHPRAEPYEYTKGPGQWQVSWFSQTKPQKELMQV